MKLSGWGRFPREECRISAPRDEDELRGLLEAGPLIARGNGRSYGDSAYFAQRTVDMRGLNRILAFHPEDGRMEVEAGVLLGELLARYLPEGWFPPVTPGTKHVTVGGMVAADVHGKNHHRVGSFGSFVEWMDIFTAQGEVVRATRETDSELFHWTVGGMGLTGVILRVGFRMKRVESGWIRQRLIPAENLSEAMEAFEQQEGATYSVAWLDCLATGSRLGRSLVMAGEHATLGELSGRRALTPFPRPRPRRIGVPVDLPGALLNRFTVRAFNAVYYQRGAARAGERMVDWDEYFYPLDAIRGWNRIYGSRGFLQFQCVIPLEAARSGLTALLEAIASSGQGSFLAVLKRFGPQEDALSFPMEGYTVALDFPLRTGTLPLMDELDAIVLDHGGRFYLAKDARMSPATMAASDPRLVRFRELREEKGWAHRFRSAQSERLGL